MSGEQSLVGNGTVTHKRAIDKTPEARKAVRFQVYEIVLLFTVLCAYLNTHPNDVSDFQLVALYIPIFSGEIHISHGCHVLDHLATHGASLTGGQVAVVTFLQVDAHLPWCLYAI
jgi:hypothetical protein